MLCLGKQFLLQVIIYGDFQLRPEVVRHPHFEVPYPQLKRGQQTLGALVAVVRLFRYIYTLCTLFRF